MEFNDEYPHYETLAQHDEASGKVIRKNLWKVFWIMLVITIVELIIGLTADSMHLLDEIKRSGITLKVIFLTLTIVKAAYIVMEFMHLGHENKFAKWVILCPYISFIGYLAVMGVVGEGNYANETRAPFPVRYTEQKADAVNHRDHHGAEATPGAEHHEKGAESHEEGAEHK